MAFETTDLLYVQRPLGPSQGSYKATIQDVLDATGVHVGADEPEGTSVEGALWWCTTNGRLYVFYNDGDTEQWVDASPAAMGEDTAVIISENTPTGSISDGQLWWSKLDGRLYIYYEDADSSQWVDASPAIGSVNISDVVGGIPEAPIDGDSYVRRNADWEVIETLGEAPDDGNQYVRKNKSWQELSVANYVVNVKDYGAVGNGVTDDTASIQAALNTSATGVYFPPGFYRIEGSPFMPTGAWTLQSTVANRKIWGDGAWITATANITKAFKITGANNEFSLNCFGADRIATFVDMEADNPYVHNCKIQDLKADPGKAIAIQIGTAGSFTVSDNIIQTVEAIGDGVYGNGVGMARAIAVEITAATNVKKPSLIANNTIDNIIGEEGDAIVVQSNQSGTYYNLNTLITGNTVHNFNRRGVKIQGDQVKVVSNNFFNSWSSKPVQPQTVIDMTAGEDHVVSYNTITNCEWFTQIKIFEDRAGEVVNNCSIIGNIITKLGGAHDTSILYFQTSNSSGRGDNLIVKDNVIDCPGCTSNAIGVRNTRNVIIQGNTAIHDGTFINTVNCTNVGQNYNLSVDDLL